MQQIDQKKDDQARSGYAPAASRIYYGWIVAAACFLIIAPVMPLMLPSFGIFQVPILDEFHWARGDFAKALAIHMVFSGLAAPVAGGLIDRFGPRRIMPIGALMTALALILMSRGGALWHFYVAFGLMAAAGSSLLQIVPLTTLVSNWFARHRGTAIGIVSAGTGAGQLAVLPLVELLINRIGWRHTYLFFGLVILVIPTTMILLFLHTRPEDRGLSIEDESGLRRRRDKAGAKTKAGGEPGQGDRGGRRTEVVILNKEWAETDWTLAKASRTFRFRTLALVMTIFSAGMLLVSVQIVAYLKGKGYGSSIVASFLFLQGALNMVGEFFGGFLCDRIGREKTLTLSLLSFCAGIVFLNLAGTVSNPMLVYVFTLFYGIGQGMVAPALMTSASDLFQGKHFGSILGVIFLGGYFGGAFGAWLGGRLFDLTGAYKVNFLISVLAMLISAALIWWVRPGSIRQMRRVETL